MEFAAMGRLEVRVSPDDVGKRVSIRRLAEAGESGGRFTDTVGILTSWDDGVVVVTRRSGEQVRMAESSLVAGKVVPAAPARRRGPSASYGELAHVTARAWQPLESERLGEWLLRAAVQDAPDATPGVPEQRSTHGALAGVTGAGASGAGREGAGTGSTGAADEGLEGTGTGDAGTAGGSPEGTGSVPGAPRRTGFTRRANSALPLGDPGVPLPEALARVHAWYARRGLPAYIQTATGAEGTQELLCAELEAHGWRREVTAELQTAPLVPVADPPAGRGAGADRVHLSREIDDGWLRRYHRTGGAAGPDADVVRAVLAAGPSVWFASVRDEGPDGEPGAPAAIGRCVVDGRWAGFMAVEVAPQARRRGLATAVMAALARRALDEGASAAWLQVEAENTAAQTLYRSMGFDVHHSYHHYRR
nr:GNAT family N-acetyltransferase [Streptomyces sp. TS71-3]